MKSEKVRGKPFNASRPSDDEPLVFDDMKWVDEMDEETKRKILATFRSEGKKYRPDYVVCDDIAQQPQPE